ncbi:MAG: hypothetical protein LBI48_09620 [Burkholderiaceae bacterium]|jgi:hypothetical protein|nr:hypothetical protein [Burkholderiaceae bacterium]
MNHAARIHQDIANRIYDALKPMGDVGGVAQCVTHSDPFIACLSLKDERSGFLVDVLSNSKKDLQQFLDQWKKHRFLDLRWARFYPPRHASNCVRLFHESVHADACIHVFKADLPGKSGKTLLIGFNSNTITPDFCHTFYKEQDAMTFLNRWLAKFDRPPGTPPMLQEPRETPP